MQHQPAAVRGETYFAETGGAGVYVGRFSHNQNTARHHHLFYELVYVEAGSATQIGAQGPQRLGRGDLIVIRPGVWHAYHDARRLVIINCLIQPQLLYRLAGFLDQLDGTFELLRKPASVGEGPTTIFARKSPQGEAIGRLLSDMIDEQKARVEGYESANIAALHGVLVRTVRLYERQRGPRPPTPVTRADQAVLEAVDYLQRHYQQSITLHDLARRTHLSPAHLSRCFARGVGMGVVQFIHRLRAEEACRLLSMSGLQVGQIAARVGYDEVAYFSRCFKRQIGLSPRQYRQQRAAAADRPAVAGDA